MRIEQLRAMLACAADDLDGRVDLASAVRRLSRESQRLVALIVDGEIDSEPELARRPGLTTKAVLKVLAHVEAAARGVVS